jgi:DNA invertase Pin-like site-specific DNA recombinase
MRIGYARVSTADQNPDLQEDALQKAGCEKIFRDIASGAPRISPHRRVWPKHT